MRQKKCFVIMPFSETSTKHTDKYWTDFYVDTIRDVIISEGYHCYRTEKKINNITSNIIKNLIDDELVVAVLTDYNPNVWYELAARHTFHKNTIMIMEKGQRLPFDIQSYGVILYEDSFEGLQLLASELKEYIRNGIPDNTDHSSDMVNDLEEISNVDNPILGALTFNKYICSLPNSYRIVQDGFGSISLPYDFKLTGGTCDILVIGIKKIFIPKEILRIITKESCPTRLLINRNRNVSDVRAAAICRPNLDNYYYGNERNLEDFLADYGECKNIKIREYTRYPFGLYMHLGNYSWFAPLWNAHEEKSSAIYQLVMEIPRKSHFGWKLHENFEELWEDSVRHVLKET